MKIGIIVPVKRGSIRGNEITALRWKSILEELNHEVEISTTEDPQFNVDFMIAVHAIHSNGVIRQFRQKHSDRPLLVCLSGTDLHGVFDQRYVSDSESGEPENEQNRQRAMESLEFADVILLLEPKGMRKLPEKFVPKCRVIFQSAEAAAKSTENDGRVFPVSVIGHLRNEKDPMLAAQATRILPDDSKIELSHVGAVLEGRFEKEVAIELRENPRYRWLGKLDHTDALEVLVNSKVTVLTSSQEGAPSIISEAVVNEIPVLATRIDATEGMLDVDYPGLFPVGDVNELARLLSLCEQEPVFLEHLQKSIRKLRVRFQRKTEVAAWSELIECIAD